MDFARVYELHNYFSSRRYPVPRETIQYEFGYGRTVFHELRNYMVDFLGAPIKNKKGEGYYYDLKHNEIFELPGLWFNAKEVIALVLLEQIGSGIQPELTQQLLTPVKQRLNKLLAGNNITQQDWENRLKIVSQWQRNLQPNFFINISQALLNRTQINIQYWKWSTNHTSQRTISPQRMVYYRNNWYLDAWCHNSQAIRTFSIDAIREVENTLTPAHEINVQQLNYHVEQGYGIFSGEAKYTATLKFSGQIAQRVSNENWHPKQTSEWSDNNEYILTIPYSQPHELVRDIMSYGSNVEVISPTSLRELIKQEMKKTLEKYL